MIDVCISVPLLYFTILNRYISNIINSHSLQYYYYYYPSLLSYVRYRVLISSFIRATLILTARDGVRIFRVIVTMSHEYKREFKLKAIKLSRRVLSNVRKSDGGYIEEGRDLACHIMSTTRRGKESCSHDACMPTHARMGAETGGRCSDEGTRKRMREI